VSGVVCPEPATDRSTLSLAAGALAVRLGELADLLEMIDDDDYVFRPPGRLSGSVGAHVRHVIDHARAVVDHDAPAALSYDCRTRQTPVEERRSLGMALLRRAAERVAELGARSAGDLSLEVQIARDGPTVRVASSLERELIFVLQHTIHHQAIVALVLAARSCPVPPGFGYAPATPVGL
jgi:uncharacterized damage-inducible protein DinB